VSDDHRSDTGLPSYCVLCGSRKLSKSHQKPISLILAHQWQTWHYRLVVRKSDLYAFANLVFFPRGVVSKCYRSLRAINTA